LVIGNWPITNYQSGGAAFLPTHEGMAFKGRFFIFSLKKPIFPFRNLSPRPRVNQNAKSKKPTHKSEGMGDQAPLSINHQTFDTIFQSMEAWL
jgi:hypothetical protein